MRGQAVELAAQLKVGLLQFALFVDDAVLLSEQVIALLDPGALAVLQRRELAGEPLGLHLRLTPLGLELAQPGLERFGEGEVIGRHRPAHLDFKRARAPLAEAA